MQFSEAWLREWVSPPVETQTLADQLSMAGLEVDAVTLAAPAFSNVLIGAVVNAEPHPNADKLRVCSVDVGADEPLDIVCGAPNVQAGQRVPVALVGAVLPSGLTIKRAKLRGVASTGMICSVSELGLAETSDGIWVLPADAPVGEDLRAWLALDDHCIEVDLTPDRADCLSIAGLAREVAAINRLPLRAPRIDPVPQRHERIPEVTIQARAACPRYACRILADIDPAATTPLWMQERLRRGGLRAIHPVVDVTNYVLLELGQPMHGFDLEKLGTRLDVRLARPGESLELLNGQAPILHEDSLVIADHAAPVALAGIMGGARTAVDAHTRQVLLESAFFAPAAISGRARRYGLHTDSSHRFERGVDPDLQVRALERATALLLDIVGGTPGPVLDLVCDDTWPRPQPLHLRRARIAAVLGLEVPEETVIDLLGRLGLSLEPVADGWRVTPPSQRFDLLHEVDLIAEIGRIHGYDRIPVSHALSAATTRTLPEGRLELDRARDLLVDRGYHEVIAYSFVSADLQRLIDPDRAPLRLANPLSAELSVMRTSLWPGLIQAACHNQARQQERLRLFETGLRFQPEADGLAQPRGLGGLVLGPLDPEQWGQAPRPADFFDVKADVEALLRLVAPLTQFGFTPAPHPALHPGQSALIEQQGRPVGRLGMLHPTLASRLDLNGDAFLFELDLDALAPQPVPLFAPISRFPSVRRDLAILVDASVPYARLAQSIREAAGDLLQELVLFDLYAGSNIDSGRKSLAFGLIFQASSRTLTDQIIDESVGRVVSRLADEFGARLRD